MNIRYILNLFSVFLFSLKGLGPTLGWLKFHTLLLFFLVLTCSCGGVSAGENYLEKRLSQQLMLTLKQGEAMKLPLEDGEFMAIYSKATTANSLGAVIILHDIGAHCDWAQLISPLRTELPAYGWHTLSLQLPLVSHQPDATEYEAIFKETHARIAAGIAFLNKRGLLNLVIIGHSVGGTMALSYLANKTTSESNIIAFAGIGLYDQPTMDNMTATHEAIADIQVPVLDIVGDLDRPVVLDSAKARARQAQQSGLKKFRQLTIPGADHAFTGLEKTLLKRIRAWLQKQAPSMQIDMRNGR